MKKTLMLIALFVLGTMTTNAQSTYPIQDTVTRVAPHMPGVSRYSGSGTEWFGDKYSYTKTSEVNVVSWLGAYPLEKMEFRRSIGSYLTTTSVSTLTPGEADVYYDLKAVILMIDGNVK